MNNVIIPVNLEKLLAYRAQNNLCLFADTMRAKEKIPLYVQATDGIIIQSEIAADDKTWKDIKSYTNVPIPIYDKRIVSHDFTEPNSWPATDDSTFNAAPDEGKKLIITSIQVRFPEKIALLQSNKLYFKVHLYYPPAQAVVPVINLEYSSVRDLVKKTNNPLVVPISSVEDVSSEKLIEMEFKYSDPNTLQGSPITLHSSRGEFLEMGLTGNLKLKRRDTSSYDDENECWCVINGKQVVDF